MKNILYCLFPKKSGKVAENYTKMKPIEDADFETAIRAAGYGKFNIFLIIISLPMSWMSIFETTTMSYVFPAAQCDLNLSLEDKGMLNAVTYGGTLASGILWGFLFDTLGRKKLLIFGYFIDGIFVILSGFSQNLTFLVITKFMGGFIMSGPFAALNTYLSELHAAKFRSRVPLLTGLCTAMGNIYLPLFASVILPMDFSLSIGKSIVIHSWGLYLLLNAIPALLGGTIFCFLPESPKFLMSQGRNDEALKVFQRIFSINTGKNSGDYPIKTLLKENINDEGKKSVSKLREGWTQISPLFSHPLLKLLLLVGSLQMCCTMSLNTLRLWLPQLFQAITDYKFLNNENSSTFCQMLSALRPSNETRECFVNKDNFEVYLNSIFVSAVTVGTYLIAGTLVNILGQNLLLFLGSIISATFAAGIYFSPNSEIAVIFIAGFVSLASLGSNVIIIIAVNLFPTTLRTMTVSLVMMFGRGAAMVGNIVFPYFLEIGCAPPFFGVASLILACGILSLFLPKQNKNFI